MRACPEKLRLIEKHKAALDAMLALDSGVGIVLVEEYSKLLASMEAARNLARKARTAVEVHQIEHRC